jgi:acetyltransferase-like isoleucine patch superfamily enzyme
VPGADIGENCIIGAGSVVRGRIPPNSIVVGNPGAVVGDALEWGRRKLREYGIDIPDSA